MGKIKKILENELVGGTQTTDVYPVTSVKAVYDENNERLDHILNRRGVVNVSTNYNDDHIAEVLTLPQAIAKIPSSDRTLGFVMTFLTKKGWETYQYTGDTISEWTTTSKWNRILNNDISIGTVQTVRPLGRNIFNKDTLVYNGMNCYISPSSGEIVYQPLYNLFVSHLIPLDSSQSHITLHKSTGKIFSETQGYRFFDENGKIVSIGNMSNNNYITISIPSGAVYFQFSTVKDSGIIVEYGNIQKYKYERFISSDDFSRIVNLGNVFFGKYGNINLFDESRVAFGGASHYINPNNGRTEYDSGQYGLYISHPILVDPKQHTTITIGTHHAAFSNTLGYRFVNHNGDVVSYGNMSGYLMHLNIPDDAEYLQISINKKLNLKVCVVYGEIQIYTPYSNGIENTVISGSKNLLSGVYGEKNCYLDSVGTVVIDEPNHYDMFLFNPIPIKENTKYTIGCVHSATSITGGGYCAIYDDGFAPIEIGKFDNNNITGKNYWEFITPTGAKYLRFAVSHFTLHSDEFLFEGSWEDITDVSQYTVNGANLHSFCPSDNADNITDGKNLYDSSIQSVENRRYISPNTGATTIQSMYDIFISGLMKVSYSKKYLTISCSSSFDSSTGWRFFDGNMQIISFGSVGSKASKTIEIPIGAVYFQFSTSRNKEQIQVEYGKEATAYTPYEGIASTYYVDSKMKQDIETSICLPSSLLFTKNRKQPLYFTNFINIPAWDKPNIQIFGTGVNTYNGRVAVCNIQSDTNLIVNHYDSLVNNPIKTISAKSIDPTLNSGKDVKIMCLGDSYTEISYWVEALKNNLIEDGVNVNLIGAMHSIRNGNNLNVSTENQTGGTLKGNFMSKISGKCYVINVSGISNKNMPINYSNYVTYSSNGYVWTVWGYDLDESGNGKMRLYCSNNSATLLESGTLTKVGGTGDKSITFSGIVEVNKNPFWNVSTDAFDVAGISSYFSTWGFEKPDILILQFMWGDLTNWASASSISTFITNLKSFISLFRSSVGTSLPVIFSIEPSAPTNTGQNYNTNGRKFTVLSLAEALYSSFSDDENTYICPSFAFVDGEHAFGSSEVVISSRFPNYKESASTDSIHPIQGGMYQIGDAITPYVHYILSLN